MNIDEAINHARKVALDKSSEMAERVIGILDASDCKKCAEQHEQLAEWLEELKQYRAIGTVEEIEPYVRLGEKLNLCDLVRENARLSKRIQFLEVYENVLKEYKEIVTVEECREAVERLKLAEEAIRKLLCSEYGSSCKFCIHENNKEAMCKRVGGSGSWCCENAKWNGRWEKMAYIKAMNITKKGDKEK